MTFKDLFETCVNPHEDLIVFDGDRHIIFGFDEFVNDCYKSDISYRNLCNLNVHKLCVNGDSIQCEVSFLK